MMRAIVQQGYGAPERVLKLAEVDAPVLEPDRALVRVRATSINAGDWRRVRANPALIRIMEGMRRPKSPLFGGDVAGVVEAVGNEITDLSPGDEVYGIRSGAFAEYVASKNMVRKPANLTLEEAASTPIAGITALQAVRDHGRLEAGQRVLVNGAGGGVGTMAVQIAKALGGTVTAVTRTENVDLMHEIGADRVIDYRIADFTRDSDRYDVIVDVGGNRPVRALRRILAPGGRLVLVGAGHGGVGAIGRLVGGTIRRRFLKQPIAVFIADVRREDLETLRELIEAGRVRPVVDRTYPLGELAAALRYVEEGRARGKVVVTV
jgi:NADPH:quinone reductase-like Zn-dependent oxidoreductase